MLAGIEDRVLGREGSVMGVAGLGLGVVQAQHGVVVVGGVKEDIPRGQKKTVLRYNLKIQRKSS
mgnify:CR=1 FL=1